MRDLDTSRFDEAHKALFRFIDKVNSDCARVTPDDFAPLHALGWTDEALYFAVTVCALFNFYNRWVDGCGVHALSDEAHRQGAKRMAVQGYAR
jgi:alkylhydroperoxidase family enzyme